MDFETKKSLLLQEEFKTTIANFANKFDKFQNDIEAARCTQELLQLEESFKSTLASFVSLQKDILGSPMSSDHKHSVNEFYESVYKQFNLQENLQL